MAREKKQEKIKRMLEKYGAQSVEKLMELADSPETPSKLRADIFKWFAEMEFGKPTSKQSDTPNGESVEIILDGELEKWSE